VTAFDALKLVGDIGFDELARTCSKRATAFGHAGATGTPHLACKNAGRVQKFTPVRGSYGESQLE
jgi:hypothetical protein